MAERRVSLGEKRGPEDGCRRYRPIGISFDSRNVTLDVEIQPDWEAEIQEQWRRNQSAIRMGLLAQLGTVGGETKIENFRLMGTAPWSVVAEHQPLLAQIRSALAHGDYYPALVGSCALGERILNNLILTLRSDYADHATTTKQAMTKQSFDNWDTAIRILSGWVVLTDDLADKFRQLKRRRNEAIHWSAAVVPAEREPALEALRLVQEVIEGIFSLWEGRLGSSRGSLGPRSSRSTPSSSP